MESDDERNTAGKGADESLVFLAGRFGRAQGRCGPRRGGRWREASTFFETLQSSALDAFTPDGSERALRARSRGSDRCGLTHHPLAISGASQGGHEAKGRNLSRESNPSSPRWQTESTPWMR